MVKERQFVWRSFPVRPDPLHVFSHGRFPFSGPLPRPAAPWSIELSRRRVDGGRVRCSGLLHAGSYVLAELKGYGPSRTR